MPAEAARFYRRLAARDRWFILLVVLATVGAVAGIVVDGLGSSQTKTATRCVHVQSAGFMGGILTEYCDARATAVCRSDTGRKGNLSDECARLVPALRPE
jgi:hypothetical protein